MHRYRNRQTHIVGGRRAPMMRWIAVAALCHVLPALADDVSPTDVEFFEKKIRPILTENCYECHGPDKAQANLRLDSAQGWLEGGDSGPAIVPGNPEDSRLVQALQHAGEVDMPPDEKLPEEAITLIASWVKRGAPAPRSDGTLKKVIDIEKGRKYWSYQPPRTSPLPEIVDDAWSHNQLDRWILVKLKDAGVTPQPQADRQTLARRLFFDLGGIPPAPEEIDAFVNDPSPCATENLIDRLLASPRFGERWGRHWLDVVRYAESITLRGFILPEAWRYRDFVVAHFNEDRPFGEFVREQIAGDLLPSGSIEEAHRRLVASTFWTLGNTNLEEQDKRQLDMDVVDEQIDVMGKAILGQTLGCARCHDHKFDPIPTRDYYAIAGILRNTQALEHANVSKWIEAPLRLSDEEEAYFKAQEALVQDLSSSIEATRKRIGQLSPNKQNVGQPIATRELPGIVVDDREAKKVGAWSESTSVRSYIGDGYIHDNAEGKGDKTVTFAPKLPRDGRYEVRLAYTPSANRSAAVPVTIFSGDGEKTIAVDMRQAPPIHGRFLSLGEYKFEVAGQSFVLISNENTAGHVIADAVQFLPRDSSDSSPQTSTSESTPELAQQREKLATLEAQLKDAKERARQRPMAMTLRERKEIVRDCPVHLGGSVHRPGEIVPRGFVNVIAPAGSVSMPADQSGRVELADWLVSHENPLTARVFVNRCWHWLFGSGIVLSVDNFGTTGELPSHLELLDELALDLIEHGSVKRLIREMASTSTYCQPSRPSAGAEVDPENRLFGRGERRRLEAESLYDAMLSISGELDLTYGGSTIPAGKTADYGYAHEGRRRALYMPVFRNALPEIFIAFDFADPSLVVGQRSSSTVAPQALYLLNNPFVRDRASAAAQRILAEAFSDDRQRAIHAFRCSLGRPPREGELAVVDEILSDRSGDRLSQWREIFHLLFLSLDFRYRH